jgi:hypothetical protein
VIEKYGKDFVRMYEKKPESPWLLDKKSHTHFCKWDLFF